METVAAAPMSAVREFVRDHLVGQEALFDAGLEAPVAACQAFQDAGLANWWIPTEYGGRGVSLEDSVDLVEELAYGDAGVAFTLFISVLATVPILLFGTATQKQTWLGQLARGGYAATQGSEREAGSELLNMTTTATRVGDDFVVNGVKYFSTNAAFADPWLLIAKAPAEPLGFVALAFSPPTGAIIRKRWPMVGLRASATYEVEFKACHVPATALLDDINGLRALEIGLNASRILIATTAVGMGRRIRDLCLDYAKTKPLKGGVLLGNHVFVAKMGQMEMQLDAMLAACRAAGRDMDRALASDGGSAFRRQGTLKSALVAKMLCGQVGWNIATVGSEMFGGLGYTRESLVEKLLRDMRHISIVEGGDDVLRETLFSRYVLPQMGRPR
ncbi:MAG TPA: acyl-CoA dehydrogenase family protein [Candidatus Xenobia bacterium]